MFTFTSLAGESEYSSLCLGGNLAEKNGRQTGIEDFLRLRDGGWFRGFGRQDGRFVCIQVVDGHVRWKISLEASASEEWVIMIAAWLDVRCAHAGAPKSIR